MKLNQLIILLICLGMTTLIAGCAVGHDQVLASDESQVKLRSIQSRAYDTTDKIKTLRAVISTLQDLGFVIDKADDELGTVSATKARRYIMRVTVTVKPRGKTQMVVRANAQYDIQPIENPRHYQAFFEALSKAMFLQAHQVD